MQNLRPITVTKLFDSETISGSSSSTSAAIDLSSIAGNGVFSCQVITSGAASTLKLTYTMCYSRDGNFITPDGASDIVTAHSVGEAIYSITPAPGMFMKIVATETAGNQIDSIDLWLTTQ